MGMTRGRSPDYWIELFGNFFFFLKKKNDWLVGSRFRRAVEKEGGWRVGENERRNGN
jgi:hypothetical protein